MTIPAIYTKALLQLNDGERLRVGDVGYIVCVDSYRNTFEYREADDLDFLPLAYNDSAGFWVRASYSEKQHQYRCFDLTSDYAKRWTYAVARSLSGLTGVRRYRTASEAIRRYYD